MIPSVIPSVVSFDFGALCRCIWGVRFVIGPEFCQNFCRGICRGFLSYFRLEASFDSGIPPAIGQQEFGQTLSKFLGPKGRRPRKERTLFLCVRSSNVIISVRGGGERACKVGQRYVLSSRT